MISTEEYKQTVKAYTRNLFRFLFKSMRDEEAVNDIIQDCFLKLWQHRKNVDKTKIKAWLFSAGHNAMINYLKKNARQIPLENSTETPLVHQQHDFEIKAIIDKTLSKLPPVQKSILLLRDLEGYEYKEIGDILDLSESQVKVYLFRARLKVKNTLKSLMNVL